MNDAVKPRAPRVAFLDLARCLAIVLMVFAHLCDSLLEVGQWQTRFGQLYGHVRGLTAPLFFLVSGCAFAVATLPRFQAHRRYGPEVRARLSRALLLFAWGSALTLPWWAEGFPFEARAEVWYPFLSLGVLHCIAVALVVGQVLLRVSKSPAVFAALSFGVAAVAVLAAPALQAWGAGLPPHLGRGAFFAGGFAGGFPILPWAAFFWFGGTVGAWLYSTRAGPLPTSAVLVGTAAVALGAGTLLDPVYLELPEGLESASPALFLRRLGVASGLLSVLPQVARVFTTLAQHLRLPAANALTFYVGHMLIIWGVPSVTGLYHRLGPTLSFTSCAGLTALCLAFLWAVSAFVEKAAGWLRASRRAGSEGDPATAAALPQRAPSADGAAG